MFEASGREWLWVEMNERERRVEKEILKENWKVREEIRKKWNKFDGKWLKIEGGKVGINGVCRGRMIEFRDRKKRG